MTVFNWEMRRGWKALLVWCVAVAGTAAISVSMFPSMKENMAEVTELFASMGTFTSAFGMDRLALGSLIGFYGVEVGAILGLGGGMFAAFIAIAALAKEEGDHTAEFLLAHPIKRISVVAQKLLAVLTQIILLNIVVFAVCVGIIIGINEEVPWRDLLLLHGGYLLMQIEVALICFGISAFLRRNSVGIGLGLVLVLYFANIIYNIGEKDAMPTSIIKYISPFAYVEPATVLEAGSLDATLVGTGFAAALLILGVGVLHYLRKDIL